MTASLTGTVAACVSGGQLCHPPSGALQLVFAKLSPPAPPLVTPLLRRLQSRFASPRWVQRQVQGIFVSWNIFPVSPPGWSQRMAGFDCLSLAPIYHTLSLQLRPQGTCLPWWLFSPFVKQSRLGRFPLGLEYGSAQCPGPWLAWPVETLVGGSLTHSPSGCEVLVFRIWCKEYGAIYITGASLT